ncbi:hypothetical protein H2203_002618 [Taxawa tesnikishii (nom. ined.)]|nr:hypothetical protein H2203_002618 [Dothideales sp. JES 119]
MAPRWPDPVEIPTVYPLVVQARTNPHSIDQLLKSEALDPQLPSKLAQEIDDQTGLAVTPRLYGIGKPWRPPHYFAICLVNACLLGRAYSLLYPVGIPDVERLDDEVSFPFARLPVELKLQIYEHYAAIREQRARFWAVMSDVFAKAFFSGVDPEPGAWFAAGVLILTCGKALSATKALRAQGKRYVWYSDYYAAPLDVWTWGDLKEAVFKTENLPRDKTDLIALQANADLPAIDGSLRPSEPEYVSAEVLQILDQARTHLENGEDDWSSGKVADAFLGKLIQDDVAREKWTTLTEAYPNRSHQDEPEVFDWTSVS